MQEPGEGNIRRSRIVCRNSIGKAVMNAGLYAQMSVQVIDKKSPDGSVKKTGIIVNLFNAVRVNALNFLMTTLPVSKYFHVVKLKRFFLQVEDSVKQITLIRLGKEADVESLKNLFEKNVAEMS